MTTSHNGKALGECPVLDPADTGFWRLGGLFVDWRLAVDTRKLLNRFIYLGLKLGGDRRWIWVWFGVWSLLKHLDEIFCVQLQVSNYEHHRMLCGISLSTSISY